MAQHRFEEFVLRTANRRDLQLAAAWTAADPDHAGRVDPAFWIEQGPKAESWLLFDRVGPVFFFKAVKFAEKKIEIHVQFGPEEEPRDPWKEPGHRRRIRRALIEGTKWLEETAQGTVEEMHFETGDMRLAQFCEKHLKFTRRGRHLSKRLEVKRQEAS